MYLPTLRCNHILGYDSLHPPYQLEEFMMGCHNSPVAETHNHYGTGSSGPDSSANLL
jgi:hypothetical protein